MPATTRKSVKKVQEEDTEGFSDIVMDDFEEEVGYGPIVEASTQSQSDQATTGAKRVNKKTTKTTEPKKTVNSRKKAVTETKPSVKVEIKRDAMKTTSVNRSSGPMRRLGLSKRTVPKDPPSPVRL